MNLEIAKIALQAITPFLLFIFGAILVGRTEKIRLSILRSSNFSVKWADEFFVSYQHYLAVLEEILTYLVYLQTAKDKQATDIVDRLNESFIKYTKAELHISLVIATFPEIDKDPHSTSKCAT